MPLPAGTNKPRCAFFTGAKVNATQKGVLMQLADDHNEDRGCAWPSVPKLAKRVAISEKQCRRVLHQLEVLQLIQARPRLSDNDARTSNEYRFWFDPAFDKASSRKTEQKLQMQSMRAANRPSQMRFFAPPAGGSPPLPRMGGAPGHRREGPPPTGGTTPLPPMGGLELLSELPVELPDDPPRDPKESIPTLPPGGRAKVSSVDETAWQNFRLRLKSDLASVPQTLAQAKGFAEIRAGVNDFDTCFRDWWLLEVQRSLRGILLLTAAADEDATAHGMEKYRKRLEGTARRFFGVNDRNTPIRFKLLRTAQPATLDLAASEAEAAAAVAAIKRGPDAWDRVKLRLQELLEQRRDKVDTQRNYREAIAPVTLVRESSDGAQLVWDLQPLHQKKTQAVISLFRRELDQAIREVMGRGVRIRLLGT